MSEILYKGLAAPLKLDAEELIASLKTEGGEWLPEEKIASIFAAKFTEAATAAVATAAETARKKGQSEETKRLLRFVKNAGFQNPDNLIGDELLQAFNDFKEEQSIVNPQIADKPDQMSKDDLAKLPIVKSLIVEAVQAGAQKYESLKKDFDAKQTEFEQFKYGVVEGQVKTATKAKVREALKKGNVILTVEGLDIDPEERVEAVFERFWNREKVGLNADGHPIILNADGEPKTDPAFGKPIDFDEIVVGVAKPMFGISTQNPNHQGSGIQQSAQNGKPGAYTPTMRFDNEKSYNDYVMTESDPGKRAEATKSWQHQQSKAAGN